MNLTQNDLSKLREFAQSSRVYLSVYQPKVVRSGRLYMPDEVQGYPLTIAENYYHDHIITYNNLDLFGSVRTGQTIKFYDAAGRFLGKSRVRKKDGDNIYYSISEQIPLVSGCSYAIYDYHELWPVFPRVVMSGTTPGVDLTTTYYKDYDMPYTVENINMYPNIIMGTHYAGFVDETTHTRDIIFAATGTYCLDPISAIPLYYRWEVDYPASISPDDGVVTGTFPAGNYTIKCTVVTTNGVTGSAYRHIILHDRPGTTSPIIGGELIYVTDHYYPFEDWTLDSLNADWDNGYWTAKISVGKDANLIQDDSLIILWSENDYGNNDLSFNVGPFENGNPRNNILFCGYITKALDRNEPFNSKHTFEAKSISGLLMNKEMFSVTMQNVQDSSRNRWDYIYQLTVNKIFNHYIRWHSTLFDIADVYPFYTPHGSYPDQEENIMKGEFFTNIKGLANKLVLGNIAANKYGQVFMEVELNMLPTGTRPPTTMQFDDNDWLDALTLEEVFDTPVSSVLLGGVSSEYTTGSWGAYLSRAPDAQFPSHIGKNTTVNGLALTNQTECNLLAGLYFAWKNNRFGNLSMKLANNFQFMDIAPQRFFQLPSVNPFTPYDWRGISTDWQNRRIIPRKINYKLDKFTLEQEITFEAETYGQPGETVVIPPEPPKNNPPVSPPPPGGGGNPGNERVWVVTKDFIGFTTNFTSSNPTWRNRQGVVPDNGVIRDFCLDPWDCANRGMVATENYVYFSSNMLSAPPTWRTVLSPINFPSLDTYTIDRVAASITQEGRFYVGYHTLGSYLLNGAIGIMWTDDFGVSWDGHMLTSNNNLADDPTHGYGVTRIMASHNIPYKAWWQQGQSNRSPRIFNSVDMGTSRLGMGCTVNEIHDWGVFRNLIDYDIAYPNADQTQCAYEAQEQKVWVSQDFGASWLSHLTTDIIGHPSETQHYLINIATWDANDIMVIQPSSSISFRTKIYNTTNMGDTWSTLFEGTGNEWQDIQSLGRWPYDPNRVFLLNHEHIYYSTNKCSTFQDKNGNWASVWGGAFTRPIKIVPIWID